MSIADEIRKRLKADAPQGEAPVGNTVAQTLATKATGRVQPSAGTPAASSVVERAAQADAAASASAQQQKIGNAVNELANKEAAQNSAIATGRDKLAASERMAASGLAADAEMADARRSALEQESSIKLDARERMAVDELASKYNNSLNALAAERRVAVADIFETFRQESDELVFRKDAAQLEQLAFEMSMANKAYVDELIRVGKLRGLQDEVAFKKEMTALMLGDQMAALLDDMNFKSIMAADQREFEKEIANMDIAHALAIADAEVKASTTSAIITGVGTLGQSYIQYNSTQPKPGLAGVPDSSAASSNTTSAFDSYGQA